MTTRKEFSKGSKMASVSCHNGSWVAWCGYRDDVEGSIPARWFKGYSTCSNTYASEKAALKAVEKFLNS